MNYLIADVQGILFSPERWPVTKEHCMSFKLEIVRARVLARRKLLRLYDRIVIRRRK